MSTKCIVDVRSMEQQNIFSSAHDQGWWSLVRDYARFYNSFERFLIEFCLLSMVDLVFTSKLCLLNLEFF